MLANELRIGNYITISSFSDSIHTVSGLNSIQINTICRGESGAFFVSGCQPIPLTEQWLKDFGFEKNPDIEYITECFGTDVYYYLYGEMLPYDRIMKFDEKWCLSNSDGDYNTNCQYVHQLQNLYFALTGKELTKC